MDPQQWAQYMYYLQNQAQYAVQPNPPTNSQPQNSQPQNYQHQNVQPQYFQPNPSNVFVPNPFNVPPQFAVRPTGGTNSPDTGPNSSQRSSQFSQTGVERINLADDFEAVEVPRKAPAKQKHAYTAEENALLARCWIDISTDSIVGNDQRMDQMWNRIAEAYNANRPKGSVERLPSNLKSHYYTVQKCSRDFNNCYIQVTNVWGSGCNDADIEDKAQVQYAAQHEGKDFVYVKAWKVLKDCQKFLEGSDVRGSKKTKVSASGEYVVSSNTDPSTEDGSREEPPRPMGRNAARRKAKGKGKATTSSGGLDPETMKRVQHLEDLNEGRLKMLAEIARAKTEIARAKNHKILMKDTSKMTQEQLRYHLHIVEEIKKDMGM